MSIKMKLYYYIRRLQTEDGQALVLFAIMFCVLCGIAGFSIDVGNVYLQKIKLQNAVDAGALAGAQSLQAGNTIYTVQAAAQDLAEKNVQNGNYNSVVQGNQVTVTSQKQVPAFFAKLFGYDYFNVTTTAAAAYGPIISSSDIVPIGVTAEAIESAAPGEEISFTGNSWSAGNWGYLDIDGNGGSVLGTNIQNGVSGTFKVGDSILTKPGKTTGPVDKAIQYRIDEDSISQICSSYTTATEACQRVVTVPIVDGYSNGRSTVTVDGFAEFYLEPYNSGVCGYFIKRLGDGAMNTDPTAQDFGADTVKLIR